MIEGCLEVVKCLADVSFAKEFGTMVGGSVRSCLPICGCGVEYHQLARVVEVVKTI